MEAEMRRAQKSRESKEARERRWAEVQN